MLVQPPQCHLSNLLASPGGDFTKHATLHDGVRSPGRAVHAEWRERGDDDAVLGTHLPDLLLAPPDVHLHLFQRWRHGGEGEQPGQHGPREVSDADGPREAEAVALLHGVPDPLHVERHEVVLELAGRSGGFFLDGGDGPVDEERGRGSRGRGGPATPGAPGARGLGASSIQSLEVTKR
uniref:Uncharacterized protein n=1 Tax=Arundo donax TaxID=35708 RepID=A0A0A8XSG9_ARUDO